MKTSTPKLAFLSTLLLLAIADCVPQSTVRIGLVGEAQAIIGLPFTPLSYAGVARRTAFRTTAVVASTTAATTAAAEQSAAAAAAAAAAAPPPPAAGPVPIGTVVTRLPAGCVSAPVGGVEYYLCGGNYYRATFQGNSLVYVVQRP